MNIDGDIGAAAAAAAAEAARRAAEEAARLAAEEAARAAAEAMAAEQPSVKFGDEMSQGAGSSLRARLQKELPSGAPDPVKADAPTFRVGFGGALQPATPSPEKAALATINASFKELLGRELTVPEQKDWLKGSGLPVDANFASACRATIKASEEYQLKHPEAKEPSLRTMSTSGTADTSSPALPDGREALNQYDARNYPSVHLDINNLSAAGPNDPAEVKKLQSSLVVLGYLPQAGADAEVGTYGAQTQKAVAKLQAYGGIASDGATFGNATRTALAAKFRELKNGSCGPTALQCLSVAVGAELPLETCVKLARDNGLWSPSDGMFGYGAFQKLMAKAGVDFKSVGTSANAASSAEVIAQLQQHNPVVISTTNHYFVAQDYKAGPPAQYYVGETGSLFNGDGTGTGTKPGATNQGEWMTLAEISSRGGGVGGVGYATKRKGPAPTEGTGSPAPIATQVPAPSGDVAFGQSNAEVGALQHALEQTGYLTLTDDERADPYYGNKTAQAVKDLQKAANLPQTGVYDQATHDALVGAVAARAASDAVGQAARTVAATLSAVLMTPLKDLNYADGANDAQQVTKLQTALVKCGYLTQEDMNSGPGTYGERTKAAVARLQQEAKPPIQDNGEHYGEATRTALRSKLVSVLSQPGATAATGVSGTTPNAKDAETAKRVDASIAATYPHSKLAGMGATIVAICRQERVPVDLMVAQMQIESSMLTAGSSVPNNNPGNLRFADWEKDFGGVDDQASGFTRFPSPEQGLRAYAHLLNTGYRKFLDAPGGVDYAGLVHKYAPGSDNNDEGQYTSFLKDQTAFLRGKFGIDTNWVNNG